MNDSNMYLCTSIYGFETTNIVETTVAMNISYITFTKCNLCLHDKSGGPIAVQMLWVL